MAEVRRIVHQLAGAAGTFGYGELGELAISIDDRLIEGAALDELGRQFRELLAAMPGR